MGACYMYGYSGVKDALDVGRVLGSNISPPLCYGSSRFPYVVVHGVCCSC